MDIGRAVDFEFLVIRAWLEVGLCLLLYIVRIVTMGSSSRASLNGVSSAIPNAFHSCDLWLFTEGKEFILSLRKKPTDFFKMSKNRSKLAFLFEWFLLTPACLNI